MDCGEEISGEFVVARGDGAVVFDLVEEALHEITFAVEGEVTFPLDRAVGLGRDHRGDSPRDEGLDQPIGVISLVAEQRLRTGAFEKGLDADQIVNLAGGEREGDGVTQSIDQSVDLGG